MSKVDVKAIAEGHMGWSAEDIDPQVNFLQEFASLILEEAAKACETKADDIERANSYRGSVNRNAQFAADMVRDAAIAVRTLKPVQP